MHTARRHYFEHYYPYDVIDQWFAPGDRLYQVSARNTQLRDSPPAPWRPDAAYAKHTLVRFANETYRRIGNATTATPPPPEVPDLWRLEKVDFYYPRVRDTGGRAPRLYKMDHAHALHAHNLKLMPHGRPHELEFVVDLDVNDWDEKRRAGVRGELLPQCVCAGKRQACQACWLLLECAAHVLRVVLGEREGYRLGPALAVFSGGKGLHLWWATPLARTLTDEQRSGLAREFERWRTHARLDKLVSLSNSNAQIGRLVNAAYSIWLQRGVDDVTGRALFAPAHATAAQFEWLARFLPPSERGALAAAWMPLQTSAARWKAFVHAAHACGLPRLPLRVALEVALPLPDVNLYQKAHMIKLPFSLHHSERARIALPLDAAALAACDPATMPNPQDLMRGDESARRLFEQAIATTRAWQLQLRETHQ